MYLLEAANIQCPYCGETIPISVDCSIPEQEYVEDCQVCCRPITINALVDDEGNASITVRHENE